LWDGACDQNNYQELKQNIIRSFGNSGLEEKYQTELRGRRRRRGESLQSLYMEIRRMMSLAYPGETGSLSEVMAKDAFIAALDDRALEQKVREHEPKTLDAALKIATRFEVYGSTTENQNPHGGARVNRQVQSNGPSQTDRRVGDLEKQLNDLRRQLDEKDKRDGRNRVIEMAREREEFEKMLGTARQGNRTIPIDNSPPAMSGPPGNRPERLCYNCNMPGHIARLCPQARSRAPNIPHPAVNGNLE
jgi:hypothetical protein